jgi:anti-anti-sigma factor
VFSVNEHDNSIGFKFSSEMSLIDRVIKECVEFARHYRFEKIDNLRTVLRELLINAVEHGNENNIEKAVECDVEYLGDNRFKIVVGDQGDGFDHKNIDLLVPDDPTQSRHRGLPLANALADQLAFNETGNRATAYLTMPTETDFDVEDRGDAKAVLPSGNLTAGSADKFRVIMLELLDGGATKFIFDLKKVEDVDSISLSLLITFAKMLKKKTEDGTLDIKNAKPDLVSLFELTRLNRIYNISKSG